MRRTRTNTVQNLIVIMVAFITLNRNAVSNSIAIILHSSTAFC